MNRIILLGLLCCGLFSQMHAQVNLSSGLVAYYPFNSTFNDASGNGNNGVAMNGATFATDQWGNPNNAALFDGIDDWVNVSAPSFTFGHKFSFAFRFKTNSTICQCLLTKCNYGNPPTNLQFQVAFNHPVHTPKGIFLGTNHTGTCSYGPAGEMDHFGIASNMIQANTWYCMVFTFNNGVKSIYMNGTRVLQTTVSGVNNPTTIDSCVNSTFRIGNWWQNDPLYFNGIMDELRLWNRAINQQEIDSLCNLRTIVTPPAINDTIINRYAAITGTAPCNTFTVDTATGFAAGDTVLMIQMKGATVDTGNTSSFGTVLAYNGAGNYEYNVIKAVSGNNITLLYELQRSYDIPGGRAQLVYVPSYASYTISRKHTCLPWTGTKGGVFALRVRDTLSLNADVDVSGRGFRGGQINYGTTYSCDHPDYFYPLSGNDGGMKGEGIAELPGLMMRGKGKLANGGGGGNNANGGGGGGSNAGPAGDGGRQFINCNPSIPAGGSGGASLTYNAAGSRLYLGGGGGCGHEDNANTDPGGAGAGIIIINTATLAGNGHYIRANGLDCIDGFALAASGVAGDGQSGGGAGGAILIKANNYSTIPFIEAKGGNGGNVYATVMYGPGGGGGAGAVLFSGAAIPGVNININGGKNGTVVNAGSAAHYAQPGQAGIILPGIPAPANSLVFHAGSIIAYPSDTSVCEGAQVQLGASGGTSYTWTPSTGLSNPQIANPVATISHSMQYIVSGNDANACPAIPDTINITTISLHVDAYSDGDAVSCSNSLVQLHANGALAYHWSPAALCNDSTSASPVVSPGKTTVFTVTGTDASGCNSSDTITVLSIKNSAVFIPSAFTPNGDGLNETFRPIAYCDFEVEAYHIYNRWGQSMFYGYKNGPAWDGTYKGRQVEPGVYFYMIGGHRISTSEAVLYKGDLTLIR